MIEVEIRLSRAVDVDRAVMRLRELPDLPTVATLRGAGAEIAALLRGSPVAKCELQPAVDGVIKGEITLL